MNIKFKDTLNITTKAVTRPVSSVPPSSSSLSHDFQSDLYNKKRPLKANSQNLSFKGLSSYKGVEDAINKYASEFGEIAGQNLRSKIDKLSAYKNSGVDVLEDTINFTNASFLKRVGDILVYPITKMPLDIANATLKMLKKIPGLKNSTRINRWLESDVLKNRREFFEYTSQKAGIQHYFEILNPKEALKVDEYPIYLGLEGQSRLNTKMSQYDSTAERTLTRAVTGIVPAFFLANDAYNLSIYMNNNKDLAEDEKNRRFKQELARIGITSAATFGVLKLFSKSSNSSAAITTSLMAAVTLVSEIIGRKMAGNPVLPVGKDAAKHYAEKQGKLSEEEKREKFVWVSDESFKGGKIKNAPSFAMFEGRQAMSGNYAKPPKKGSLTLANALKIMGALVVVGFGVDKLTSIKSVKRFLTKLNNQYKNLYTKDLKLEKVKFNKFVEKFEKKGFNGSAFVENNDAVVNKILKDGNFNMKEKQRISDEIQKIVDKAMSEADLSKMTKKEKNEFESKIRKGIDKQEIYNKLGLKSRAAEDVIYLTTEKNNVKYTLIHQVLTFPIKFAWDTVMLPYKKIAKPIYNMLEKAVKKVAGKDVVEALTADEIAKNKSKKDIETLKNTFKFVEKIKSEDDFVSKINENILGSLDNVTKSSYSNADLSSMVKVTTSGVTSAFLIADNYNMVMVDSQGNDKELAEQKAKERTLQRIVRIIYGAFLIKLFNGVFSKTYNASLLGAQMVNTGNVFITETMERTSVGLPLRESNREEILEKEKANLEADGFAGSYFRLMSKLTGKKTFAEKQHEKKKK